MIPISLHIPETPRELIAWLESHLVGMQLGDLVAELQAVHGEPQDKLTLADVCSGRLPQVLQFGLGRLDMDQIRSLFRHPHLLLELQDEILLSGGEHWLQKPVPREDQVALASQWKLLNNELAGQPSAPTVAAQPQVTRRGWLGRSIVAAAVSAAAAVTATVMLKDQWLPGPAPAPGWGWDKPGALASNLPPREYLNHIADAAEDWFKKRPDNRPDLARRITQFRQGCSTLMLAEHPNLAAADRDWLRERCRAWATKLDGHLAAAEAGEDILTVRAAADETVNKLIKAIRDRAQAVA